MLTVLYDYLSEKILDDLHTGRKFNVDFLNALLTYPLMDYLRNRINEIDKQMIIDMIKSSDLTNKKLGINLARRIRDIPEIRETVIGIWYSTKDFYVKVPLIWALSQYNDLPESLHKEFYEFFRSNHEILAEEIEKWFAGKENLVSGCKARLQDRSFYHKRWMYLYCLSFAPDKKQAKVILEQYLQDEDTFVRDVATTVIEQLGSM